MKLVIAVALILAMGAGAADAKQCRDEKGKFAKCPPPAVSTHKPPVCKTGKLCGNTCIAKTKVCHKP